MKRMTIVRGFTLIELLVVTAIMALLASMILSTLPKRDAKREVVNAAAAELAATLRKTRAMAIRDQSVCAVVFNISNAVGSSGRVLNNRDGGHWYRVIGSTNIARVRGLPIATLYEQGMDTLNMGVVGAPSSNCSMGTYVDKSATDPRTFVERVIGGSWLGDPIVLPKKEVRFLALSDTDEGPMRLGNMYGGPNAFLRAYGASYPRPWFGFFDTATKRLYPWGGYDKDYSEIAGILNPTGFYYEGFDGKIPDSRNPASASAAVGASFWTYRNHPLIMPAGESRAVVNANLMDYYIAFRPDGTAQASPFAWIRRYFWALRDRYKPMQIQSTLAETSMNWNEMKTIGTFGDMGQANLSGAFTTTKNKSYGGDWRVEELSTRAANSGWFYSMQHFTPFTGGWYVTLGVDAKDDNDVFDSTKSAIESFMPATRVFIAKNGEVSVIPVRHSKDDELDAKTNRYFPTTLAGWTDPVTVAKAPFGYLCRVQPSASSKLWGNLTYSQQPKDFRDTDPANPRLWIGPITDRVTNGMIENKRWWSDAN